MFAQGHIDTWTGGIKLSMILFRRIYSISGSSLPPKSIHQKMLFVSLTLVTLLLPKADNVSLNVSHGLGEYISNHSETIFELISLLDLKTITTHLSSETCQTDTVLEDFWKRFHRQSQILSIINFFLSSGSFLSSFKNALICHLSKKTTLDYHVLSNFRPLSNFSLFKNCH